MLSLGTYILGSTASIAAARELADVLFSRDPWWVKHYIQTWGRTSRREYGVISEEPEFMPLEEQTELFAQRIKGLGRFQFLLRPALAEGHIDSAVVPLSIGDLDRDKETGEYQFPDAPLMARLRTALAKQAGIPIARLLQEQEQRLPQALPESRQTRPEPTRRLPPPQPRLRRPQTTGHQKQQPTGTQPASPDGSGEQPNQPRHQRRHRKD